MRMHFIMTISFFLIIDCRNFPSDRPPPEHDQLIGKSPVGMEHGATTCNQCGFFS